MKKLNFGCGPDIRRGWDNCDIQKSKGVIFCDGNKFPYPFKDNTYDLVCMREVLPVLDDIEKVLDEIWRITKYNGAIEIEVPYYNGKGAINDFQAKNFFNDTVFEIFVNQRNKIKKEKKFEIIKLELEPTNLGKLLPKYLREKVSLVLGGFISKVHVILKPIKR